MTAMLQYQMQNWVSTWNTRASSTFVVIRKSLSHLITLINPRRIVGMVVVVAEDIVIEVDMLGILDWGRDG